MKAPHSGAFVEIAETGECVWWSAQMFRKVESSVDEMADQLAAYHKSLHSFKESFEYVSTTCRLHRASSDSVHLFAATGSGR